jgi:gluconate 2-dehydrogenase gamma chain
VIRNALPWVEGAARPPPQVEAAGWRFFTADEATAMEAIADRLIPPDPETLGGKDCGCAVFIDRQLAGQYGQDENQHRTEPFQSGTKEQGAQTPPTRAMQYRQGLAALGSYCRSRLNDSVFASLPDDQKDQTLKGLEAGSIKLEGIDSKLFFTAMLIDTQQGFFSDPVCGGNKDMASWKMIGFPGVRYDYRDWVHRHNERFPLPPISIRDPSTAPESVPPA